MTYESYLKVSELNKKGYQTTFFYVKATKTIGPHGSGEASNVLYDDNHLVDFMLNHFRWFVNSYNGSINVLK